METLFKENRDFIIAMAKKINRNRDELSDLISEANLIFVECATAYDENKGIFSKYLSTTLYYKLYEFVKKRDEELNQLHEDISLIIDKTRFYEERERFEITGVSEDTKNLIEKIFCFTGKIGKGIIYNYAKNVLGWKKKRIKICFKEIERLL